MEAFVGRKNETGYPKYMRNAGRGAFYVTNPTTGVRKWFTSESEAIQAAQALAAWLLNEKQAQALNAHRPTFGYVVPLWLRDKLQFQPWDKRTIVNYRYKLERIAREFADKPLDGTSCMEIEDWIAARGGAADNFIKWRRVFVMLYSFAIGRQMGVTVNEAEKIELRSTSKKLMVNQKKRTRLDVAGFKAIYAKAPEWLNLAMDLSLLTLQSRNEICNMRHDQFRDGHLFVIRDKVSGDSDMAFIKIQITPELEGLRAASRRLDNIVSPYLVHRKPVRRKRINQIDMPHWTYVRPDYLSKAFQAARDAAQIYDFMPVERRPGFHEIRSLGARLSRARGVSRDAIRALMTHANAKTTAIYLDGGVSALADTDYTTVKLTLSLTAALAAE